MAAPVLPRKLAGRYEIREVLGQGGMGLVYRAYDSVIRREVALKTLRDTPEPAALQLFYKECDVLASMSHPNIIEIFDIGEFEEEGQRKPYFVMPLLPGRTLDHLIRNASHRLTVERTVEIMTQTCRGLQAAHERGLVHRDLKPSNIFVMEDDSVKVIDFGVAHMTSNLSTMGQKGTLLYMSPEQIEMKPLSAVSDIFSLSVVCYEALTGRQPFRCTREDEIVDAILHQVPPAASELNPAVHQSISRVVHKGMAKQPWHRFATARDLSETLMKALRNQPIEIFDPVRIRPRIERASRALEQGDFQFAGEILGELQAEGHIDTQIGTLRQQLDRSVRQKTISQLLESAKARFDEEEDPLALQKLQEILQIEPDNGSALHLKSKIENRRSDRQIDSWYRLATQHIENHAYTHAREALQNVLQIRPKESRALQLLSTIGREEQDYNKLRQEKANLHRAAVEAWQKGEVSAALTKLALVLDLDRRAPDSSNPERSAAYQSLYNQVRSEHDALNNGHAEARKHLADRNFAKAFVVCDQLLAKYPGNALFQALKFDIEEQQRQDLSAFIASIDRQAESELDLDKRVSILKDALAQHPDETHFAKALRLTQDKRDLVNSIVARARHHEEQGLFSEALGDWEILNNIYNQYPGLRFEIERLQKRRDQQTRNEAKSRWTEHIDSCMHSGDYGRALDLLQQAQSEFPEDTELAELEKVAREGVTRSDEAQRLMQEGQDLCADRQWDAGIQLLRQAYELDEHNAISRAVLSDALVEQARLVLDRDWKAAEVLVQQALDLNPLHAGAKGVRTLALDRKREEFVGEILSQARRLQAAGDISGAQVCVGQGLAAYATEPRLLQLRDSLERESEQTRRRQDRRRDLEELRRIDRESENVRDPAASRDLAERAQALATKYVQDPEVANVASALEHRLVRPARPSSVDDSTSAPPQAGNATMLFSPAGAPAAPPPSKPQPGPPAKPVAAAKPPLVKANRQKKPRSLSPAVIAVAAGIVIATVAVIYLLGRNKAGQQTAGPDGGTPSSSTTQAHPTSRAGTDSLVSKLAANVPALRVFAESGGGKIWFDDKPPADLEGAQWMLDEVSPGEHTLKFAGPSGDTAFSFTTDANAAPILNGPITANGVHAVVVGNLGGNVRVYCSFCPAQLSLDGQPPIKIGQEGTELSNLSPGAHKLALKQGDDEHVVDFDLSPAPSLTTFVATDRNVGSLLVVTGEDKAQVFLNGQLYKRVPQGGQLRIPDLEPNDYVVRVVKPGFQQLPDQHARIIKGQQIRLAFNLAPLSRQAILSIENATPGAEVVLDQQEVGVVLSDGTFRLTTVLPGDHVVELRKEGYKPVRVQKQFIAGAATTVSDVSMQKSAAELKISFVPPDATVTLAKPGDDPVKVVSGTSMTLAPGAYTLVARTTNSVTRSAVIQVVAGESRKLDLSLTPLGMENWGTPGAWRPENNYFVRHGGGFILYRALSASGTFIFSASLQKGKRLQWVVNFVDDRNYQLFSVDDNYFYRNEVRNGETIEGTQVPLKMDKKKFRTLQVHVSKIQIVHQVFQGDKWVILDSWAIPSQSPSAGSFGFYIPSNDEIGLANFNFYADLVPR
jgi:eukaryotic-like serine/threonine-protein kinase